jgi:tetratricopeptide (TPR) repeat protein
MHILIRYTTALAAIYSLTFPALPVSAGTIGISTETPGENHLSAPSAAFHAAANDFSVLQEVVMLLNQGERKEAKIQLARFLSKQPHHPQGTEMAGLIFMEEKNWDMAVTSLRRALSADPQRVSARSKLGVALLMNGKTKEGLAELQKVIALNKKDGIARRYLGWQAEAKGDIQSAITHYNAMFADDNLKTAVMSDFHVLTGKLYNQIQRHDKTIALLAPLISRADSKRTAQGGELVLATAYLEQGNRVGAAKLIQSLEKTLPSAHPDLRMIQARLSMLEKNYPKARERLQAVIKDTPPYANAASFQLSQVYAEERNWKQAIEVLESLALRMEGKDRSVVLARLTALQFDYGNGANAIKTLEKYASQDLSIKYLLAEAQGRNHQYAAALKTVDELLASSPHFAAAHYLSGMLYRHENKPSKSEAAFLQAVKLVPSFVDAWVELAELYGVTKARSKAENTLRKGLEANPDNPTLLFRLASIHDDAGRISEANGAYQRILDKMPNHAPALQKLALNLSGDTSTLGQARKFAERAHFLNQNEPAIQDTYGWVLVQSGEVKKGILLLEAAVKSLRHGHREHFPNESEDHSHEEDGNLNEGSAYYHLGAAYMKAGKTAEGATYLNRALGSGVDAGTKTQIASLLK